MARPTRKSRTLEFDQEGLIVGMMLFLFVGPTKMISSEIPFLQRSFFPVSWDFARYVSGLWALFRTFQYYAQENCPKNTGPVPRLHCTFQANCADSVNFLYCSGLVRSGANIAGRFARISQRRYPDISESYLMI